MERALLAAPAAGAESENLEPYRATIDDANAGALLDAGVDVEHTGFKAGEGEQTVHLSLFPSQANRLENQGVELEAFDVEAQTLSKSLRQAIEGGDSPNPFYTPSTAATRSRAASRTRWRRSRPSTATS